LGIGSGKLKQAVFAIGLAAVPCLAAQSGNGLEHQSGIWRVLRAGHFSGPMRGNARVLPIKGAIAANGTHYRFWEYRFDSKYSGQSGTALLVFERGAHGLSYLGCYRLNLYDFRGPVHPEVRGMTVFFPFREVEILGDKPAFAISFEKGPPPEAAPGSFIKFGQ